MHSIEFVLPILTFFNTEDDVCLFQPRNSELHACHWHLRAQNIIKMSVRPDIWRKVIFFSNLINEVNTVPTQLSEFLKVLRKKKETFCEDLLGIGQVCGPDNEN